MNENTESDCSCCCIAHITVYWSCIISGTQ
nr:MAG TPA: hypothetical protein [Caudoviricetes sp.]